MGSLDQLDTTVVQFSTLVSVDCRDLVQLNLTVQPSSTGFQKVSGASEWCYLPAFERLFCDLFPAMPSKIGTFEAQTKREIYEMDKAANSIDGPAVDDPTFHTFRQLCVRLMCSVR